ARRFRAARYAATASRRRARNKASWQASLEITVFARDRCASDQSRSLPGGTFASSIFCATVGTKHAQRICERRAEGIAEIAMDETPILVAEREGYRVITLNRPQRLNAFTEAMHVALRAALNVAGDDPACRALLITGAGRGFCAGQDLNDRLAKAGETTVL